MNCSIDDFNIKYFSHNINKVNKFEISDNNKRIRLWDYLMIDIDSVK